MNVLEIEVNGRTFTSIQAAFRDIQKRISESVDASSKPLTREMRRTLQRVAREMERRHSRPWNGMVVNPSDRLQRRSGGGLRSIRNSIDVFNAASINEVRGQITTGNMTVHETGATIRPRRAQYLTIPLPAALDQRGVPLRERARDWDNTFVARSRSGNLLIFRKTPGLNDIAPLYILKREVTIRPRLGMEKVIINDALPFFERRAFEAISREIDRRF